MIFSIAFCTIKSLVSDFGGSNYIFPTAIKSQPWTFINAFPLFMTEMIVSNLFGDYEYMGIDGYQVRKFVTSENSTIDADRITMTCITYHIHRLARIYSKNTNISPTSSLHQH